MHLRRSVPLLALLALICGLSFAPRAHAEFLGIAGGATVTTPLGDLYSSLGRTTGWEANLWYNFTGFIPEVTVRASVLQQIYTVRGALADTKLGLFGGFLGLQVQPHYTGFVPFLAFDLGAVYDYLSFPGTAGTVDNNTTAFAGRLVPGFQLPVYGHLSAYFQMPFMFVLTKSAFFTWGGTFSLAWRF